MAVGDDFKKTEAGVIPSDWRVLPLLALSERIMVGIASAATHAYRAQGVVMFRNQNIKPGFLDDSDILRIDPEYEATFRNKRLRPWDLLTARTGYPGTTSVVPPQYDGAQSFTTLIIRPNRKLVDPRYLCFFINSPRGQEFFDQNQIGGGQKNVNAGSLKKLPVVLPPTKAEQEAIAGALSDADAFIESIEELIKKKRLIKQGAMQELLTGKKRLPGFESTGATKETVSGVYPADWTETSLVELADGRKELFDDGDWIEAEHITSSGTRLIQTRNIGLGRYEDKDNPKFIYDSSFNKLKCKPLETGDLLVCRLAEPPGRACVLPDIGEKRIVTSVDVTIFRPLSEKADRAYLANLFSTAKWLGLVAERSGGTTHKRIARGALGKIEICIPSVAEQRAIAHILSDMDAELEALDAKLSKARQIKRGMMHELLTGRIRLV